MGDPIFCEECHASFNCFSKLEKSENNSMVWNCEFCNHKNILKIEQEEIPKLNDLLYMVQSAQ